MLYHYSFQLVLGADWQDVKWMPHLKSEQKCAMLGTSGQACRSLSVVILNPHSLDILPSLKPQTDPTGLLALIPNTAFSGDACLVCALGSISSYPCSQFNLTN